MKPHQFLWISPAALLTFVSLGVGALVVADQAQGQDKDRQALQGTWTVVEAEAAGKKLPEEEIQGIRIVVEDDRMDIRSEDESTEEVRFSLDPSKDPKQVDATVIEGPEKGKTSLGIYEIEGDTAQFCWAEPGQPRPEQFRTKEGTKQRLFVLRKEK